MNTADCRFFVGVDGGGTRCRVRLRAANGQELAFAEGGSANVNADPDGALATINDTIDQAIATAGMMPIVKGQIGLGLGLAGVISMEDSGRVSDAFKGFNTVIVESDAATACVGAHGGADGGLVIAGTGSAGFAIVKGKRTGIGGRGFAIGDDGSAARIGWDALRQSAQAADGLIAPTNMTRHLMKKFQNDAAEVTRWSKSARAADYGALAPIAFVHAAEGDAVALPLIKQTVAAILALRSALIALGAERIALVGGLAEPLSPWIDLIGTGFFVPARYDAADGAILLAGGKLP
jgi:glucosamine kinase